MYAVHIQQLHWCIYSSCTGGLTSRWNCRPKRAANASSVALHIISLCNAYAQHKVYIRKERAGICIFRDPRPRRATTIYTIRDVYAAHGHRHTRAHAGIWHLARHQRERKVSESYDASALYMRCMYVAHTSLLRSALQPAYCSWSD